MGFIRGKLNGLVRSIGETADEFRSRRTEKPHLVGLHKKSHVVIGPVTKKIVGGKTVFTADFVRPRLGSQLGPFFGHVTAPAVGMAAHQVAVASIKKFEKLSGLAMPLRDFRLKTRKAIPPKTIFEVVIEPAGNTNLENGLDLRYFKCKLIEKEKPENVFVLGEFNLVLLPREKFP